MKNSIVGFPFVSNVDQNKRPEIVDVKEFINKFYNTFSYTGFDYRTGTYKNMGYSFNVRPYLKRYVYKQYGQWSEMFAPNKTLLRKQVGGVITEIVELKQY